MSAPPPALEPGALEPPVVPGYTLHALLGRGGSGEVWRAVPRRGGPPVAIKVLVDGDPDRQSREAALLGDLDHPHLVRLLEVVHQPRRGRPARVALVLELLDGGSLAALLARRGRLRPGEVVTAIAPVAAALAHAHEHGVIHGDLSPGNIVFTAEGRPVLTDLGVARVVGEASAGEVTPAYVDPTVARGGAPGPASDVFGIAAAAFHALTGVAPWNAATPADTLDLAAEGVLPDLAELASDAPEALLAVVRRGLAADPHERGSAAAFALDLRHATRPEPVRLPVAGVPDAELARTGRGPRTELTHQVPGRRRHASPVVVLPAQRARWRAALVERLRAVRLPAVRLPAVRWPAVRRGVAVTGLLCALAAGGWAGSRWAGSGGTEATKPDVGAAVAAATAAAPRSTSATAPPAPASPTSTDGWRTLLSGLYARRAEAFTSGSVAPLAQVYAEGSPLRVADEKQVRALEAAGDVLRGFAPTVVRVTAMTGTADRAEIRLIDRWPDYQVVGGDGASESRPVAGRGAAEVRMVVVRTPHGWRIASAERPG